MHWSFLKWLSNVTPRICWWKLLSFYCQKEFSNFVSLPSYFCKNKHILVVLVGRMFRAENSFISKTSARFVFIHYLVPKLFPLQVFLLPEIILIAEIIIIATRCLIRWEWQNFHRPYSRKNFPRLSSHKKRHKLTPHILLKTKIYEYSRKDTEAHTIFIYRIPFHYCHVDQLSVHHIINGSHLCSYQKKCFINVRQEWTVLDPVITLLCSSIGRVQIAALYQLGHKSLTMN